MTLRIMFEDPPTVEGSFEVPFEDFDPTPTWPHKLVEDATACVREAAARHILARASARMLAKAHRLRALARAVEERDYLPKLAIELEAARNRYEAGDYAMAAVVLELVGRAIR